MEARIWISEIKFSDDTSLQFEKDDIVVFVGPNNAGKSASLKEASSLIKSREHKGKVLKGITVKKEGDEAALFTLLDKFATKNHDGHELLYQGFGFSEYASNVRVYWSNAENGIGGLSSLFVNIVTTEQRLQAANPPANIKITTQAIQHPIHLLQKRDALEKELSEYFKQAFGADLIVHRNAGNEVPLYVGERPVPKSGEDRVSESYQIELEKLDLLHLQGDGMRSFVGVLLHAVILTHSILFIDEPEAFLHPPQARLLGKTLAKGLPSAKRQLFLATHSEDFLKGLLEDNVKNLKIIRIQREGNGSINKVSSLTSSDISSVWNDPLLRHSNILNGLFHSKVVICEGDADCRFFSAMLSAQFDNTNSSVPDILFIHCGGKHRIPTAIKALKKINVPIIVVSDFDMLSEKPLLKEIFENLGGDWATIESNWKIVKNNIEEKKPQLSTPDVKKDIEEILNSTTDPIFPKEKIEKINKILKKASAWTTAKEIGKSYIPSGDATNAFDKIQTELKKKSFLIIETGELENFLKSVGNHGPKWVSEVLTRDLKNDKELEAARQFVTQFV